MKFRRIELIFLRKMVGAALVVGGLLCGAYAHAGTTYKAYMRNREGIKKFEAKSYYPAYQDFGKALEDDPLNPALHLNIARAFEGNEDFPKAEQGYKGVLKILPEGSPLRFEALFNLAGVQGKQKKIAEALETYQLALELNPESIEVKTNIELLWQQGEGDGEGGEGKDPKDQKDKDKDKGKGNKDDKQQPEQNKKQQPKPFDSQELNQQDVKKILDEIKNQEQAIRADENDRGAKEAPRDKDW